MRTTRRPASAWSRRNPMRFGTKTWRSRHEPVLGTVLDIRLQGPGRRTLRAAETAVVAELDRLERVFSIFRADSDLSRWRSDPSPHTAPGDDVVTLLQLADEWRIRSHGAFNPAVGEAMEVWNDAAARGIVPTDGELARVARAIAVPRYRMEAAEGTRRVVKIGDCHAIDFHAIAKGLIIDLALRHLQDRTRLTSAMLNIGGDLVHTGEGYVVVGIEGSGSTADNAAPVETVRLSNAAMATSGGTRRGFQVGDTWFGHVIDPRTARPVPPKAGASVIAPDAATADVLATVVGVLTPAEGVAFVDAVGATGQRVACRITDADGIVATSARWSDHLSPK
jgi:FAD:protein FMN transferase